MVAKITTPNSIGRALNYNEKKVRKGQASCLHAANFLHDLKDLNFYDKLNRFKSLVELNTRAKTNTLHISLNFDPSEKMTGEKLIEIANSYMSKIGFGLQPYIVYQHHDAGHPHIHIVTTSIQENGRRIDTFNIGRNQSEKARKEIEQTYGLVRANGRNSQHKDMIIPVDARKLNYGLSETKRSIANVLHAVLHQYKYTSLAELNAVLKRYNVVADRGSEGGRMYKNRGLAYRVLDARGNKVGVPIKASSIYFKPTLHFLEGKFRQNESLRLPFKPKLKTAIDWTLSQKPATLSEFVWGLQKEQVSGIVRQNEQGFIYGITFIDHRTKVVFNGSDLGKAYSAAGLKERILKGMEEEKAFAVNLLEKRSSNINLLQRAGEEDRLKERHENKDHTVSAGSTPDRTLQLMLDKERTGTPIPFEFLGKKKKRRKPKL